MKNTLEDKTMTNNLYPQRHFWNMAFKTSPGTIQAMKTAADVVQGKNSTLPRLVKWSLTSLNRKKLNLQLICKTGKEREILWLKKSPLWRINTNEVSEVKHLIKNSFLHVLSPVIHVVALWFDFHSKSCAAGSWFNPTEASVPRK